MAPLASLFAELRRRRVFKVAGVYAIVAWLTIQVAATTFPYLMLPEWTVRLVIALSLLGLPIAVVLAWVFQVTPDGVRRATAANGEERGSGGLGWMFAAIAAVLILGGAAWLRFGSSEARPRAAAAATRSIASIAVLPFVNMSADEANAYFADGVAEDILSSWAVLDWGSSATS